MPCNSKLSATQIIRCPLNKFQQGICTSKFQPVFSLSLSLSVHICMCVCIYVYPTYTYDMICCIYKIHFSSSPFSALLKKCIAAKFYVCTKNLMAELHALRVLQKEACWIAILAQAALCLCIYVCMYVYIYVRMYVYVFSCHANIRVQYGVQSLRLHDEHLVLHPNF